MKIQKSVDLLRRDHAVIAKGQHLLHFPIAVDRTDGDVVIDVDGNSYIDFLSSASSLNLGGSHADLNEAVIAQMKKCVQYCTCYTLNEPMVEYAERLASVYPGGIPVKVCFSNSGSDANDLAIRFARAYTGRTNIISFSHSYHGNTYATSGISASCAGENECTLSSTQQVRYFQYFYEEEPESSGQNYMQEIEQAFATDLLPETMAAVFIEPIQGDGGMRAAAKDFICQLYRLCQKHGILFIVDEVQQGFFRSGHWFSIEHYGIIPDGIVLGKSAGAGFPLGVFMARTEIMKCLPASLCACTGAAAASLLGNVAGILVGLPYFFSQKRTFRFALPTGELWEAYRELMKSSSSFAADKASRVVSSLIVNMLLMYFVGNIGVALYAVYGRLKFILRLLAGGALQTISNLGSLLYGERDFFGLRKMMFLLFRYTYTMVAVIIGVLFFFSAPYLRSYGIDPAIPADTLLAFRIMLFSLPFLWLNDLLTRFYPSIQRQELSVILLALQNVVFKILILLVGVAAIVKWNLNSLTVVAIWCFLVEFLSPAVALLWEQWKYGNIAIWGRKDQTEPDCHTFSITGKPENVADIHREIDNFCQQNGIYRNKGNLLAIAFEEAVLNVINHNGHVDMIDICLLLEDGNLIVRIRDNGAPFDPLGFMDEEDILRMNNIKLLEKLTDQKTYTRIMNMNNTVLSIRLEAAENA